jgi:5-formyltetrahydrofolate cyclo-ligase
MSAQPADIAAWRRVKRLELLNRRAAMPPEDHRAKSASILSGLNRLRDAFAGIVAFYFPFRGEVDLLPLMGELSNSGSIVTALPVVVAPRMPLQFRVWKPGCPMTTSTYGIPEPDGAPVEPDVFIVPLVGFDAQSYRLGYGGGFYDRTFAASSKAVKRIGIGFEDARLDTIYPMSFDVPMDMVITEDGLQVR